MEFSYEKKSPKCFRQEARAISALVCMEGTSQIASLAIAITFF